MITLYPYQQECLDSLLWARELPGFDLVSFPTGSGKSHIIAEYARQVGGDILILQPSKELVEQNMEKLSRVVSETEIGVFSASLNRKEIKKYTFGTIGSIVSHPELFNHFKTIIIDEAHLVNAKNPGSMYLRFFKTLEKDVKIIGLTATIYRLTPQYVRYASGFIETITTIKLINRIKEKFWSRLLYNINVGDLIAQGRLCPLKYHLIPLISQEDIKVNKSKSDFDLEAFEKQIAGGEEKIRQVLDGCRKHFKSTLVFCSSVEQAERLAGLFEDAEVVSANTKTKDRNRVIGGFRDGSIRMVMNVGVLTTGFDHPALDCVVLLRPTRSLGLVYQMVGRGLRKSPGKKFCTVVDMTDTIKKVGRIESFKIEKVDGKWDLVTEKGSWHGRELYRFIIEK